MRLFLIGAAIGAFAMIKYGDQICGRATSATGSLQGGDRTTTAYIGRSS